MKTSKNDITGDDIKTGLNSDAYKDSWERVFGKKHADEPAYVTKARDDLEKYTTFHQPTVMVSTTIKSESIPV